MQAYKELKALVTRTSYDDYGLPLGANMPPHEALHRIEEILAEVKESQTLNVWKFLADVTQDYAFNQICAPSVEGHARNKRKNLRARTNGTFIATW